MKKMILFKFLREDGTTPVVGGFRWHLPTSRRPGKWMPPVKGGLYLCSNGYHLTPFEKLLEHVHETLYVAETRGEMLRDISHGAESGSGLTSIEMLVSIDTRRPRSEKDDAVSLLIACHARTRAFCSTALRLSRASNAPASNVAEVANAVLRHFTVSLPLHIEDEDVSIASRLLPIATRSTLADLKTLARQHRLLDWLVAELVPQWQTLIREPQQLRRLARRLERDTTHVRDLFQVHHVLEEESIYPTLEWSTSTHERLALAREIRERRAAVMQWGIGGRAISMSAANSFG